MAWISALPGNMRQSLGGLIPAAWDGPFHTEVFETPSGQCNRMRAIFKLESGRAKQVEWNVRTGVVRINPAPEKYVEKGAK